MLGADLRSQGRLGRGAAAGGLLLRARVRLWLGRTLFPARSSGSCRPGASLRGGRPGGLGGGALPGRELSELCGGGVGGRRARGRRRSSRGSGRRSGMGLLGVQAERLVTVDLSTERRT